MQLKADPRYPAREPLQISLALGQLAILAYIQWASGTALTKFAASLLPRYGRSGAN